MRGKKGSGKRGTAEYRGVGRACIAHKQLDFCKVGVRGKKGSGKRGTAEYRGVGRACIAHEQLELCRALAGAADRGSSKQAEV